MASPGNQNLQNQNQQFDLQNVECVVVVDRKAQPQLEVTQPPRPSYSADATNEEAQSQAVGEDAVDPPETPAEAAGNNGGGNPAQAAGLVIVHQMEWAEILIAAFWASAIDIALQSVQVQSQLPAAFHLLSLAILLAFASFCVSKFIKSEFLETAQVLEKFGVFFTATAFFIAITIPFPFYLKFASWAVYTISVLASLIWGSLKKER